MVILLNDFEVCKEGCVLTPSRAKILELSGYKLASFKFTLKGGWTNGRRFKKYVSE